MHVTTTVGCTRPTCTSKRWLNNPTTRMPQRKLQQIACTLASAGRHAPRPQTCTRHGLESTARICRHAERCAQTHTDRQTEALHH